MKHLSMRRLVVAWATLCATVSLQAAVITSVTETGGDGTVTAKFTGNTFTSTIGSTPALGTYTVPTFGAAAKTFVDRLHAHTNASATVAIPSYLIGNEYIMIRNDNRDNTAFKLDITVSQDVLVYMLIDNRIGDATANGNDAPFGGAAINAWSGMQWMATNGFAGVTTGQNRNATTARPDESGIDESADGSINNWFSIYTNRYRAGTFSLYQQGLSGNNMYAVVIAGIGPSAPPPAPTALAAVNGDAVVTLNWNAAATATGYNVKRSTTPGGPYTTIGSVFALTYNDTTAANGTDYYYVVTGTNSLGEGASSAEVIARANPVVTGIVATGGTNQVVLTWNALSGADSYSVSRAVAAAGPYTNVASGLVSTSYTDTTALPGRTYYYRVSAILGAAGLSGQSASVSAVTAPSAPALTAESFSTTGLLIRWTTTNSVLGGFAVERSNNGVDFTPLTAVSSTTRSYIDSGLASGTTYFYRVQATNATGSSSYSAVLSATTPASGYNVNFAAGAGNSAGNPVAPTPPGYVQDIGDQFGDRGNGLNYGWVEGSIVVDGRYRQSADSPDLRYDTFNHMQKAAPNKTWEIEIPNGFYRVRVVGGDATATDSTFQYNIEGLLTGSYVPVSGAWWADFTVEVGVSDGRLTIGCGPAAANSKINFVDIYPATPVAPVITAQPQGQTAVQNRTVSLTPTVTGSAVQMYQWYKGDTAVPDATNRVLTFNLAQPADSGDYYFVVTNYGGSATSSIATVTITPDTVAPKIVSVGSLDGRAIGVAFDELLDPANPANTENINFYVNDATVPVTTVTLRPDGKSLNLTLESPITGAFKLEIYTVTDLAGNAISYEMKEGTVLGYTAQDLGAPALTGTNYTANNDTIEIVGGGTDIWGAADQGYFATKPVSGDFDARFKVDALKGQDTVTKVAIVARESTSADARALHVSLNPPPPGRNQVEMGYRATTGGATAAVGGSFVPAGVPDAWLRITRVGDVMTGYRSTNGANWFVVGTTSVVFGAEMQVGFAITAHTNGVLATGVISHLTIDTGATDVAVGLSAAPATVSLNGTVTYTAGVTNIGAGIARDIVLTDVLPAGVTFVSANSAQGACSVAGGTVTCALGTLAAGSNTSVTIVVTATGAGPLANTVTASTTSADAVAVNNSATATVTVNEAPSQAPITNFSYTPGAGGGFSASIQTQNGVTYRLEAKDDLNAATWTLLQTISGDGTVKTFTDSNPGVPARYYRITLQ